MDKSKLRSLMVTHGQILAPQIDQYLARAKFPPTWEIIIENEKEWDPYFHPSSDCYTDPYILYLDKTRQLKHRPISASLRKTFDVGHMWHRYLQNILKDMGFVSEENIERSLLHDFGYFSGKGTADLVDVYIPGHGTWLVDIKTMGKDKFQNPPEDMMRKYTAQVNIYGDWLGTEKMLILAVCKDSPHDFREFIIQRDESILVDVYDRWRYTAEHIAVSTPPPTD